MKLKLTIRALLVLVTSFCVVLAAWSYHQFFTQERVTVDCSVAGSELYCERQLIGTMPLTLKLSDVRQELDQQGSDPPKWGLSDHGYFYFGIAGDGEARFFVKLPQSRQGEFVSVDTRHGERALISQFGGVGEGKLMAVPKPR